MRLFPAISTVLALLFAACGSSPPATVHGLVVVTGQSAAGVLVTLNGPVVESSVTASNGSYSFDHVPPGTYLVLASVPSADPAPASQIVTAHGDTPVPDLVLTPYGSITGAISAGALAPPTATVFVPGTNATATSDATGAFKLTHVPVGSQSIVVIAQGFEPETVSGVQVPYNNSVMVPTVQLSQVGGTPVLDTISGVATMLGGTDQSGTTVTVAGTTISTTTAQDGSYTLTQVPPGAYTLDFANGPHQTRLPNVLSVPGSNGWVVDGALYPLTAMDVPRGKQLASGQYVAAQTPYHTVSLVITKEVGPGGATTYHVVAPQSEVSFALEAGAQAPHPTWDGTAVIYKGPSTSGSLPALKIESVSSLQPVTLAMEVVGEEVLESGGSHLAYLAPDGETLSLVCSDTIGVSHVPLMTLPASVGQALASRPGAFAFTTDSQLLVCANSSLLMVPIDGSSPPVTIATLPADCQGLTMWPGMGRIIYSDSSTGMSYSVLEQAGATPTPFALDAKGIRFSPDFTWAFNQLADGHWGLVPAAVSDFVDLPVSISDPTPPVFTSDGQHVLWNKGGEIDRYDFATATSTPLVNWSDAPASVGAMLLSSDSNTLYAEIGPASSQLVAIDVLSGTMSTLSNQATGGPIALSPYGSSIAFIASVKGAHVVMSAEIYFQQQPTMIDLSYDGSWLGWVDDSTLVMMRNGTPAPYEVQDGLYKIALQ